jgi:hypothetical protein
MANLHLITSEYLTTEFPDVDKELCHVLSNFREAEHSTQPCEKPHSPNHVHPSRHHFPGTTNKMMAVQYSATNLLAFQAAQKYQAI